MDAKEKLIVALDVDSLDKAKPLVESLAPYVGCFKVGLELLTAVGAPRVVEFVHSLGGQVFYDGKFKDTPNTVARASRAVRKMGVKMFNIHCFGGKEMMRKARGAVDTAFSADETLMVDRKVLHTRPLILGVTILTSLDYGDLVEMGIFEKLNIANPQELAEVEQWKMEALVVRHLARLAQENGLDGVVCSPKEIRAIREYCQPGFIIVTPGIRDKDSPPDDQKRTMTAGEAIRAGADYLVIGRPITKAPDPVLAAKKFLKQIDAVLQNH